VASDSIATFERKSVDLLPTIEIKLFDDPMILKERTVECGTVPFHAARVSEATVIL
jgi:hypothetical protein